MEKIKDILITQQRELENILRDLEAQKLPKIDGRQKI